MANQKASVTLTGEKVIEENRKQITYTHDKEKPNRRRRWISLNNLNINNMIKRKSSLDPRRFTRHARF